MKVRIMLGINITVMYVLMIFKSYAYIGVTPQQRRETGFLPDQLCLLGIVSFAITSLSQIHLEDCKI